MNSKSLHPDDYKELRSGISAVSWTLAWLRGLGRRVDWPHPHRMWEYASAWEATRGCISALDVGAGYGVMGPTLAGRRGANVLEVDADPRIVKDRQEVAQLFNIYRSEELELPATLPPAEAVTCISVMEHVATQVQEAAWRSLARATKFVLFVTVDFNPEVGGLWMNSELRQTQYGWNEIDQVVKWLEEEGLAVAPVNREYHGNQVFNYSFFRIVAGRVGSIPMDETA